MKSRYKPQFTLKNIMVTMGVACFLLAFFFAFPDWLRTLLVKSLQSVVLAAAIGLAFFGKDNVRAFGIGATIPLILNLFTSQESLAFNSWSFSAAYSMLRAFFSLLLNPLVAGFVCVWVRKWAVKTQSQEQEVEARPPIQPPKIERPPKP